MIKKAIKKSLANLGYTLIKNDASTKNFQKNEVAFLHIGKNAGTQIMQCAKQLEQHGVKIRRLKHTVKLNQIPIDTPYFFSIRNPVSRFRSGFYSRKRQGRPRYYAKWNAHEEITFSYFEHANELAEALFSEGERGLQAAMAIKSISHTGMQQIDWFQRAAFMENFPPLWIIRKEAFDEDFNQLLKKLDLPLDVKSLVSNDDVKAHANNYADIPPLSDLAVKNLERWYVQDFAFYNVCEDWIKRHSTE